MSVRCVAGRVMVGTCRCGGENIHCDPTPLLHVLHNSRSPDSPGYPYTRDLLAFDRCFGILKRPRRCWVSLPLNTEAWESMLACHPGRRYAQYIIDGLRGGFRIGVNRGRPTRSAASNMPLALQHERCVKEGSQVHAGPVHTQGDSHPYKQGWGDPKRKSGKVEADHRPVVSTRV